MEHSEASGSSIRTQASERQELDTAMQEAQDASTESKKPHLSIGQKIKILRDLVKERKSKEEICEDMNLSPANFNTLFFYLIQQDKVAYEIPHKSPIRQCVIGTSGFTVSMDKILNAGLEEEFRIGRVVEFHRDGKRLVLEAVDKKIDEPADEGIEEVDLPPLPDTEQPQERLRERFYPEELDEDAEDMEEGA